MDKERLTPREYLDLRKQNPLVTRRMLDTDRSAEIQKHEDALRKRNIDVTRLLEVLRSYEGDPDTMDFGSKTREQVVDDLVFKLIEALEADRKRKEAQATANARSGAILPDSLVNGIVLALVEHIADMPDGLVSLLQMRLDPKLANPNPRQSTDEQRAKALVAIARNPSISTRELARAANVNQATASRWKNDRQFMHAAKSLKIPIVMHKI